MEGKVLKLLNLMSKWVFNNWFCFCDNNTKKHKRRKKYKTLWCLFAFLVMNSFNQWMIYLLAIIWWGSAVLIRYLVKIQRLHNTKAFFLSLMAELQINLARSTIKTLQIYSSMQKSMRTSTNVNTILNLLTYSLIGDRQ